jgi:hypothetical protein|tara:strand:- start:145 stop:459 length:315 start_codon:yes stop_codon:yes gene_type:complete
MEKLTRGSRNLEKLQGIVENRQRARITFWNPTEASKSTNIIDTWDASAIVGMYQMLGSNPDSVKAADNQRKFTMNLATASGFISMLELSWKLAKPSIRSEVYTY